MTGTPTAAWRSPPTASDVDGDAILAILAVGLHHGRGRLARSRTVVSTVMANIGFHQRNGRGGHHMWSPTGVG